tara:strand:- start:1465 stop:2376 length:912 start_codon:yes stop_codon:yes gene_type:complete
MDIQSKIILISGPTASGKTNFAIKLAKKFKGEIINADSMQVYKEYKALTARPSLKDQKKIKHHLFGFLSIKKKFSTGQWLKLAFKKIKLIKKKNKIPILVGGTGLYFKALVDGLVAIPKISIKKRKEIINLQNELGQINFYNKLIKIDPKVKDFINSNDVQRSIRAYEVKWFTDKSLLDWYKDTRSFFTDDDFLKIYIDYPKDLLLNRIKIRTKKMLPQAIKEVKRLKGLRVAKSNSSNKIIGINEIKKLLDKKYNKDQTIELIIIKTRQYAKRQATWARSQMRNWNTLSSVDTKLSLKKLFN